MKDEDDILSPKGDVKRKYSELSDDSEGESEDEALISKIDRLADESGSDKDYSVSTNFFSMNHRFIS